MIGPDAMFAVSGLLLFALPLAFYMLRDDADDTTVADPVAEELQARKEEHERRDRRQELDELREKEEKDR